jgi:hypothetical protein
LGYITDDDINPPAEPLPEPELTDLDALVEAMYQPEGFEELIIVSMLAMVGIGVYNEDGSPIRAGLEQSDDDIYVTEDETRGLVEMLKQGMAGQGWINFTDFASALTEFGVEASAEEISQAYQDAYDANPDEPMTRIVQTQAFLDPQGQLAPLGVWLLFVDGMVQPNDGSGTSARGGALARLVAAPRRGHTGIARPRLQQLQNQQAQVQGTAAMAKLLARLASLNVRGSSGHMHEGHGGLGDEVTFTAILHPVGAGLQGLPRSECIGSTGGIPVKWKYGTVMSAHGTPTVADGATSPTDPRGVAETKFTAQREAANGHGYQVSRVSNVIATVPRIDVIRAMCGELIARKMAKLAPGDVTGRTQLMVEWHERYVMHITLTDSYEVDQGDTVGGTAHTDGDDMIDAVLVQQDDGSWVGAGFGKATGNASGTFIGIPGCPISWNASQILDITGKNGPSLLAGDIPPNLRGDFALYFEPTTPPRAAYGTRLCAAALWPGKQYKYIPFNDSNVYTEIGFGINLPKPPWQGGQKVTTLQYLVISTVGSTSGLDYWDVRVEYPDPPPSDPPI